MFYISADDNMIVIGHEQTRKSIVASERANTREAHTIPDLHRVTASAHERTRVGAEAHGSHVGSMSGRVERVEELGRVHVVHLFA